MDAAMPGPGIWDQYAVAGILFVVIVVIGVAVRKVFREYREWQSKETELQRDWQEAQYQKRETENEKQRNWYSEMEKQRETALAERDKQWTAMVREIQALVDRRDRESHTVLTNLTTQIGTLTELISKHDRRVEEWMQRNDSEGIGTRSGKRRIS
jgi:flagellar biosynthesis/type III secretory pathway M-ring protein FliF/YscJ